MHVRTPAEVGHLIRQARRKTGLTQKMLAAKLGTTQSWISEVENGKETAEIGMVLRLLALVGLQLDLAEQHQTLPVLHAAGFGDYPDIDAIVDREGWRR